MDLEVAPRAGHVRVAPPAKNVFIDVGHEGRVGERVAPGSECFTCCISLESPFDVGRLTRPPERPNVVQLERIGIHDDKSVASLLAQEQAIEAMLMSAVNKISHPVINRMRRSYDSGEDTEVQAWRDSFGLRED